MTKKTPNNKLSKELAEMLMPHYAGMEVTVEHSQRWQRMCVTFRWEGFTDLLPEERFERLVRVIPEEFRQGKLGGFVWLELVPGEDIDAFLKLPRSDDIADREEEIYSGLEEARVFDALKDALGPSPSKACQGEFSELGVVLATKKFSSDRIRDARLLFIRNGAYCDCQAILTVRQELARLYGGGS